MNFEEKDLSTIKQVWQQVVPEYYEGGADNDGLQMFFYALAMLKKQMEETSIAALNNTDITTASEEAIERGWASSFAVYRKGKTTTKYYFTITTNASTTITTSFRVSDDLGNVYKPTQSYNLVNGINENILFEAVEYGAVVSTLGSVNIIQTETIGILSISNTTLIEVGHEVENYQTYQARLMSAIVSLQGSNGTYTSIIKLLENNAGCERAIVYYNNTTDFLHRIIPAGNTCVVCYGGKSSSIFEVLKQLPSCIMFGITGIKHEKTIAKDDYVTDDGVLVAGSQAFFVYNSAVAETFYIKIVLQVNTGSIVEEELKNYLVENIENQRLCDFNTTINANQLQNIILVFLQNNNLINSIYVSSVLMSKDKVNYSISVSPSSCYNILSIVADNISIEYIN